MPNFLIKYSNGYGHLIMSVVTMAAALYLVNINQVILGTTLIGLVSSAWFVPGAARQVAQELNATPPVDEQATMPQIKAVKWTPTPTPVQPPQQIPPMPGGNNGR
jgi:hypothetical protein